MDSRGATIALMLAFVAWAIVARRWRALIAGALALCVSDPLCSRVLKPAIARERPCRAIPGVRTPSGCGAGAAMPSTHAANTAALAVAAGFGPLVAVSSIVGISRVVNGQHWPSDVVVGWIVGVAVGGAAAGVVDRGGRRLARTPRGAGA